jgi:hypothetical protein
VQNLFAVAFVAMGFAAIIAADQPSVASGDDDAAGGTRPFNSGKPVLNQIHIVIGILVGVSVLLVSAFGLVKLGIKAMGVDDASVVPGAAWHGVAGQVVWGLGLVNVSIGLVIAAQPGAPAGALIAVQVVTIIAALALVHKVADGGVSATSNGPIETGLSMHNYGELGEN